MRPCTTRARRRRRLRYAAELAVPALGEPAEELASAAEEVQQALGEHQDTVMSRRFLREQGARMHRDGMNGFTLGRLHAIEEARAAAAAEDFERAWAQVKDHRIPKGRADVDRTEPVVRCVVLVPQARVELATFRLGGGCSIH